MAKLYFKYGTMNSSKSAQLLMTAYNYKSQGKEVIALKPSVDTRWKTGEITSRALDFTLKCHLVDVEDRLTEILKVEESNTKIHAILVAEAQFLTKKHVEELASIVDVENIPVICFGLKNSYIKGKLFDGSAALLYYADSIEEIKTICQYCEKKAIMNMLVRNRKPVYKGDPIVIGDIKADESYFVPVCRKHYIGAELTNKK